MLEFLKSYLRIHGLKKFFIILLTTTFHSYFYLYFHSNKMQKKDTISPYLFYLSGINEVKPILSQTRTSNIAQASSGFFIYILKY